METPDDGSPEAHRRGPDEHDVEDPSGLVAKLRSLLRGGTTDDAPGFQRRVFGSREFFQLWASQAIASTGDWLGFLAILELTTRIGVAAGQPGTSIALVLTARIVPGLFLSAPAGVLSDRMDRKQVMVATTVVRAGIVATLPFVDSVLGLVFASLLLEMAALLFQPAKEASVPNLVPPDRLPSANSLGLAAAYGTFPLAAVLFALLAKVAQWLGSIDALDALETSQEAVAFYAQVACYLGAALIISRLAIPRGHMKGHDDESIDLGKVFTDIKDGWHFAFVNPVVRGVNLGLATGLIAGGMVVPLGPIFSRSVLGAGTGGYGVFIAALGVGVGAGIIGVSARQSRLHRDRGFVISVFGAGIALLVGVSMSTLGLSALAVTVMGVFAGSSYVLGFTLLHENVDDELRGRVFSGTYILVRVCLLLSMSVGSALVDPLNGLSEVLFGEDRKIGVGAFEISVPGVRLTLWLAGILMIGASALAALSLRDARARKPPAEQAEPGAEAEASEAESLEAEAESEAPDAEGSVADAPGAEPDSDAEAPVTVGPEAGEEAEGAGVETDADAEEPEAEGRQAEAPKPSAAGGADGSKAASAPNHTDGSWSGERNGPAEPTESATA